jgi:hypothetical protein
MAAAQHRGEPAAFPGYPPTPADRGQPFTKQFIEDHLGKKLTALSEELQNVSQANDGLKRLLNEIRPHFFDDHAVAIKIDAALKPEKR